MPTIKELIEVGAHFGHLRARSHPKARAFTFEVRDRVLIINLDKTIEQLKQAAEYCKDFAKEGKTMLFVGTKKQIQAALAAAAQRADMPYVNHRWLAGTLTNFDEIVKNVRKLEQIETTLKESTIETKRERGKLQEEANKLQTLYGGIKDLKTLPDALLVVDGFQEKTALDEARRLNIPIVALTDTTVNPELIDYLVAANDDSPKTVAMLLNVLVEAIVEGKSKVKRATTETTRNNTEKK